MSVATQCGSDKHRKMNCKEAGLPYDEWDDTCRRRFPKPTDPYALLFGETEWNAMLADHRLAVKINREQYPDGCELCGEPAGAEMGEYYDPRRDDGRGDFPGHVLCHAQCGIDAGLEIA